MSNHQITAKQSRQARSLLKWNLHDVVNKCTLRPQRIDHFERGILRLSRPENDQLFKVYTDNGIFFTRDFDVKLTKVEVAKQRTKIGEDDIIEDAQMMRELEHGADKSQEKFDAQEEAAKEFTERVQRLVNLKEDEDEDDIDHIAGRSIT
jgi:transcriptional regulator with XRE-family HTH domain